MNANLSAAQLAQQNNRGPGGRYAEGSHTEADQLQLVTAPGTGGMSGLRRFEQERAMANTGLHSRTRGVEEHTFLTVPATPDKERENALAHARHHNLFGRDAVLVERPGNSAIRVVTFEPGSQDAESWLADLPGGTTMTKLPTTVQQVPTADAVSDLDRDLFDDAGLVDRVQAVEHAELMEDRTAIIDSRNRLSMARARRLADHVAAERPGAAELLLRRDRGPGGYGRWRAVGVDYGDTTVVPLPRGAYDDDLDGINVGDAWRSVTVENGEGTCQVSIAEACHIDRQDIIDARYDVHRDRGLEW